MFLERSLLKNKVFAVEPERAATAHTNPKVHVKEDTCSHQSNDSHNPLNPSGDTGKIVSREPPIAGDAY